MKQYQIAIRSIAMVAVMLLSALFTSNTYANPCPDYVRSGDEISAIFFTQLSECITYRAQGRSFGGDLLHNGTIIISDAIKVLGSIHILGGTMDRVYSQSPIQADGTINIAEKRYIGKFTDGSLSPDYIRDNSIDPSTKLNNMTQANTDISRVQVSITGECGEGSFIQAINEDGGVECNPLPTVDFVSLSSGAGLSGTTITGKNKITVDIVCNASNVLQGDNGPYWFKHNRREGSDRIESKNRILTVSTEVDGDPVRLRAECIVNNLAETESKYRNIGYDYTYGCKNCEIIRGWGCNKEGKCGPRTSYRGTCTRSDKATRAFRGSRGAACFR